MGRQETGGCGAEIQGFEGTQRNYREELLHGEAAWAMEEFEC